MISNAPKPTLITSIDNDRIFLIVSKTVSHLKLLLSIEHSQKLSDDMKELQSLLDDYAENHIFANRMCFSIN
jgi:hypothetical protein